MASVRPHEVALIQDCLVQAVAVTGQVNGLEIGVNVLKTVAKMSKFIEETLGGGMWVGVDPRPVFGRVNVPYNNTMIVKMKSADFAKVCTVKFSIIFVDGCHCRRCLTADIDSWWDAVLPDGFMLFHDAELSTQGRKEPHPFHGGDSTYAVRAVLAEHEKLAENYERNRATPDDRLIAYMRRPTDAERT